MRKSAVARYELNCLAGAAAQPNLKKAIIAESPPLAKAIVSKRIFNLTFHGLGVPGPSIPADEKRYWLEVDAFERFLDRVAAWPDARITFDDGNLSDVTLALPRLLQRCLRASFFIVASRIGQGGYLGRSELRSLLAAGMEIGSHGMHHRPWRTLKDDELQQEIVGAKALLEDFLGAAVTQAACPFGSYGRKTLRLLAHAGFTRVYTSDRGWAGSQAWIQPRNTISATTDLNALEQVRNWSWLGQLAHSAKLALKRWR
jgi:peptidoglycan/xylan/chitin deacetylase (PgdA/CDA1 family)